MILFVINKYFYYFRVKYIKGLRVADNSIMPKITSGNTGLPATMIGEKAADMIKKTIQCKNGNYDNQQTAAEVQRFSGNQ